MSRWKYAKGLYLIPIVMAYRPLLGNGPPGEVVLTMVACAGGLLAFAAALDGYLLRRATPWERVALTVAAACLFWPDLPLGGATIPAWANTGSRYSTRRVRRSSSASSILNRIPSMASSH